MTILRSGTVAFCAFLPPLTLVVLITFLVPRDEGDCSDVFCDGQMNPRNFYFYWTFLWILLMVNSIVSLRALVSVTKDILLPIAPRRKMVFTVSMHTSDSARMISTTSPSRRLHSSSFINSQVSSLHSSTTLISSMSQVCVCCIA